MKLKGEYILKISVPLSFNTINEKSLPEYCEQLKRVGCERVFICFIGSLLTSKGAIYSCPEKLSFAISGFKKAGFEVGVWIWTFMEAQPSGFSKMVDSHGGTLTIRFNYYFF